MYALAARLGVETARIYGAADDPGVCDRPDLAFPVVLKPVFSHRMCARFARKLFVVQTRDELRPQTARLREAGIRALVMDLVPGPDTNVYSYSAYVRADGSPAGERVLRKIRQSPPLFGVSRLVETSDLYELREPALALVRAAGWRGIVEAEYKRDPRDGRFRLMDLNGRCFLQMGLHLRSGVNYPWLAWRDLTGHEIPDPPQADWNGIWISELDDLHYALFHRGAESLGWADYFRPYGRPKTFLLWSARDPLPFLVALHRELLRVPRALFSPRRRKELRNRATSGSCA